MTIVCAISGEVPDDPVLSKTGYVFSRRLIEKALTENGGKCPVTGQDLDKETDLYPIHTNSVVTPRPATSSSISAMLRDFQNEWDNLMLETYKLRESLSTTREQLSQTLYQHEAACRVICRLAKERDLAVSRVRQLSSDLAKARAYGSSGMDVDGTGAQEGVAEEADGDSFIQEAVALSEKLVSGRKKRKHPKLAKEDAVKSYTSQDTAEKVAQADTTSPSKRRRKSAATAGAKVTAIDVHFQDNDRMLVGGSAGSATLYNRGNKTTVCSVAHSSDKTAVTAVKLHPNEELFATGGADGNVRLWKSSKEGEWECEHVAVGNPLSVGSPVTYVDWHPTGEALVVATECGKWYIVKMDRDQGLSHLIDMSNTSSTGEAFGMHPDGSLFAYYNNKTGCVSVYSLQQKAEMTSAKMPHANVTALAFSENGYHMATGTKEGEIKLWDLRKATDFATLTAAAEPVEHLSFDNSGHYLAAGSNKGADVYHFHGKTSLSEVAHFDANGSALAWLNDASGLVLADGPDVKTFRGE
ncbi:Pre-mRNA-processing factor 19 [Perkinsus chesapeaki]|uniref:Pre-mRNA-processing factor 19 n=1 Tax=Perkinsus chesapeaki TaxID=330153 RepID=A0A7J6MIW1_PERCH|nr:Pre-mRNA-processing factor 19 [Perkinsus chesapeaki]